MRLKQKHTWGFMSLVAVHASTEMCGIHEKEMLYARLCSGSVSPRWNTLLALGDFNAVTGTERSGYELCVGPHSSLSEFFKIQKVENWVFGIKDQSCTAGLGIAIPLG